MPKLNPEILTWARSTAEMSLSEAAKAISLNAARGMSGAERLAQLESGEIEPSRSIVVRMAKKYRRPLLAFYLSKPPKAGERGKDFRTVPGADAEAISPELDAMLRDVQSRQMLVKSLLDDDDSLILPFVGSASTSNNPKTLALKIMSALNFDRTTFRRKKTAGEAFSYIRECIESVGIFVLLIGDLGSHHSRIPVSMFRGYAIADNIAPFIIVNDQDVKVAWPFTALHELAHIWVGETGISGFVSDLAIETFCNQVASEILLSSDEIFELSEIRHKPLDQVLRSISTFSNTRNISRSMIAYRCLKAGLIDKNTWNSLNRQINQERIEFLSEKKLRDGSKKQSGPTYYVLRRHRLGPALLNIVERYLGEGTLTHTKAGKVLGVKARNVATLLSDRANSGGIQ